MSENRDRAEMKFDADMQLVLEFMQSKIATSKLVSVADALPKMARLLWGHFPQEPIILAKLEYRHPVASTSHVKQPTATEFSPSLDDAGDGSVEEGCVPLQ